MSAEFDSGSLRRCVLTPADGALWAVNKPYLYVLLSIRRSQAVQARRDPCHVFNRDLPVSPSERGGPTHDLAIAASIAAIRVRKVSCHQHRSQIATQAVATEPEVIHPFHD